MRDLFTSDFRTEPYWWDSAPLGPPTVADPSGAVDVAVIGSGYTGLHAALRTARAGRSTLVLEAGAIGFGASTRNGGQISTSIKPSRKVLARRYGAGLAGEIEAEGRNSLSYIKDFVAEEGITSDFKVPGRFHGAHCKRQFRRLVRDAAGTDAVVVPRSEQHAELGTDAYHGGVVFPHHASINPGLYHRGLLQRARSAGVELVSHCPVTRIDRMAKGFSLETARGRIKAGRVIVATNGYTGGLTPWLRARIIPIGSYIIATEPLSPDVIDRLMPTDRILSDTRKLVYYYRPSPDRKRILFGGRVSLRETDPRRTASKLHAELARLFPELENTRISHSWSGFVGYTFDTLMHTGHDDGLYFSMGYCGSGVGMASYLGMKIGLQACDDPTGDTVFSRIPYPTRPFYRGDPWFLAPSIMIYRLRDKLGL